jgi:hypothetical protein
LVSIISLTVHKVPAFLQLFFKDLTKIIFALRTV